MPSYRHPKGCSCALCRKVDKKLKTEEDVVTYGIKVPRSLKKALQAVGAPRVRQALEELAEKEFGDLPL